MTLEKNIARYGNAKRLRVLFETGQSRTTSLVFRKTYIYVVGGGWHMTQKDIWSGRYGCKSPRNKNTIVRFKEHLGVPWDCCWGGSSWGGYQRWYQKGSRRPVCGFERDTVMSRGVDTNLKEADSKDVCFSWTIAPNSGSWVFPSREDGPREQTVEVTRKGCNVKLS